MAMGYSHVLVTRKYPNIPTPLKPKQVDIVNAICSNKDTIGILPTGYGKTLCFVLPALLDEGVALVVSPLKALQDNQQTAIENWGVPCAVLNEDTDVEEVKKGMEGNKYRVIVATPEAIVGETWQDSLLQMRKQIVVICFDEAHVISTWGNDFRKSYQLCSELRSIFNTTPMLLLTATLTEAIRAELVVKLHMTDITTVTTCLDRPNIAIVVKTDPAMTLTECAGGLLARLRVMKRDCPKCIIFAGTIAAAVKGYTDLMMELWQDAYASGIAGDRPNALISLFHSKLSVKERKRVLSVFSEATSVIRVIIATSAFSLGVHIDDVATVIQCGTPKDISSFWQQAGRAGRDGKPAECLLLATRTTYHRQNDCIKHLISEVMKGQIKCFRQSVLQHLGSQPITGGTRCCNLCTPDMPYLEC